MSVFGKGLTVWPDNCLLRPCSFSLVGILANPQCDPADFFLPSEQVALFQTGLSKVNERALPAIFSFILLVADASARHRRRQLEA